jgi:hypothetical protein
MLVRAGKIDESDLAHARELQLRGDTRRLGRILVSIGAITERELARQVRRQIEEVMFELLNWREGHFSFVEGPLGDLPADVPVRIPTEALLMEGARRIDEWSRIERKIPHLGVVPGFAPDPGSGGEGTLDLLPPEWEVLAAVDGERDVHAIAGFLGRSEFETAKTIFGLESAGVLMLHDTGVRVAAPGATVDVEELSGRVAIALASGSADQLRPEVEAAVTAQPQSGPLHILLARLFLATGRTGEAEDAVRRALRLDPAQEEAVRLLGTVLVQRGRFGEAVEWWERWLAQVNGTADVAGERERIVQAIRAARQLDAALRATHG